MPAKRARPKKVVQESEEGAAWPQTLAEAVQPKPELLSQQSKEIDSDMGCDEEESSDAASPQRDDEDIFF